MKNYMYTTLILFLCLNQTAKSLDDDDQLQRHHALVTGWFCNEYHDKSPEVVSKNLKNSALEMVGGLVLFHIPTFIPVVMGDPNEPPDNSIGYKIHGPEFRESYRTFNRETSIKAFGAFYFLHGLFHTFRSGNELLNIFAEVEHRWPYPITPSNRTDRHIRYALRGAADLSLAASVYYVHQGLKAICPYIEEEIDAEKVGGMYYLTNLVSMAFVFRSIFSLSIGGIGLIGDVCSWAYRAF